MEDETQKPSIVFSQSANPKDFVWLGIKNALLGFITLTLYRFWGRTEVRQRIWANSHMNGEAFEYTGTGGELFKGFLIATLVFTLPYLLIIFGAQLMGPEIAIGILFVYMIAIFIVIGAAFWLAMRYLASRTQWRGIRFVLGGDPLKFSMSYFGNLFLQAITFGWWTPKFDTNIAGELWGKLSFGDIPFSFDKEKINVGLLYKKFALAWLLIIIGDIFLIVAFGGVFASLSDIESNPENVSDIMAQMISIYAILFVFLFFVMIAFMPYRAEVMKQIAKATKMGDAEFEMDIDWKSFTWLYITNTLIIVLSLGFLLPVAQVRAAKYLLERIKAFGSINLDNAEQAQRGPDQAEGLSDALDIGII